TVPHTENNLTVHAPGNDDYYRFTAPSAGQFQARISFNNALGDLDLILYNSLHDEITRSDGDGDVEGVTFNAVNCGTYYFRAADRADRLDRYSAARGIVHGQRESGAECQWVQLWQLSNHDRGYRRQQRQLLRAAFADCAQGANFH